MRTGAPRSPSPTPCRLCSPPHVAFSFNGGKDSTVILHLLRATIARRRRDGRRVGEGGGALGGVRAFVFPRADDFPEVASFVEACDAAHCMRLERVEGPMAAGLDAYLNRTGVGAVVLGTRRGDPNAPGQAAFCPSSQGWPPFMRVNPVLDWAYGDVWRFLDAVRAPYCALYDRGFTSLGSVPSTRPNSALRRPDGGYAPARELADGRAERAGRGTGGAPPAAAADPTPTALTRTAAVLVVGDELLAGRVPDTNSPFVCGRLSAAGWAVRRVALLPDDVPAIAAEIEASIAAHGVVVLCGGVGPTDDDRTMEALAAALRSPLARDPDLEARLRSYFGDRVTDAHLKMADVPSCGVDAVQVPPAAPSAPTTAVDGGAAAAARTPPGGRSPFPLLALKRGTARGGCLVYVLPGVPHLLTRKWPALASHLEAAAGPLPPFRSVALRLALDDEASVGPALAAAGAAGGAGVAVGSYPVAAADGTTVVLLLTSKDEGALEAAAEAAVAAVPAGALVAREADPVGLGVPLG